MRRVKRILMDKLMMNEEEAMAVFSGLWISELTYFMWAFFSKPLFVASKIVMIVRKRAQVPILDLSDRDRIRII